MKRMLNVGVLYIKLNAINHTNHTVAVDQVQSRHPAQGGTTTAYLPIGYSESIHRSNVETEISVENVARNKTLPEFIIRNAGGDRSQTHIFPVSSSRIVPFIYQESFFFKSLKSVVSSVESQIVVRCLTVQTGPFGDVKNSKSCYLIINEKFTIFSLICIKKIRLLCNCFQSTMTEWFISS